MLPCSVLLPSILPDSARPKLQISYAQGTALARAHISRVCLESLTLLKDGLKKILTTKKNYLEILNMNTFSSKIDENSRVICDYENFLM